MKRPEDMTRDELIRAVYRMRRDEKARFDHNERLNAALDHCETRRQMLKMELARIVADQTGVQPMPEPEIMGG